MLNLILIKRITLLTTMKSVHSLEANLNEKLGIVIFHGWSEGCEVTTQYEEAIQSIRSYLDSSERLTVYFKFQFFDTHSLSYIFCIIKLLDTHHRQGKKVAVKWGWQSSTSIMKLMGEDFKELCDFPFEVFEQ
ncbi:SiaC family regulatory phosphoprotein [Ekhidna sp.]|uniref:SiaC family regulatory phosphoprotein n=1 Tax=Ekhidna sp. TaxID=2608089 RepID=UPI0032EC1662